MDKRELQHMGRDARLLAKRELASKVTMAEFAAFEEFHYCADHDCADHGNWAEAEGSGDTGESGPYFTPNKGRSVKKGQRVKIYRNLHKDGVVYSIRDAKTGLVLGHSPSVMLDDVKYEVHEAGRQRVLREKKKNVHSFVTGNYAGPYSAAERKSVLDHGEKEAISYNPYKSGSYYKKSDESPVAGAQRTLVDQTGVFQIPKKDLDRLTASVSDVYDELPLEEFYNQCNSPEDGRFCEGDDGPGRVRDEGTEDLGKPGTVSDSGRKASSASSGASDLRGVTAKKKSIWDKVRNLFLTKAQEQKWEELQARQDQAIASIKASREAIKNAKADAKTAKEVEKKLDQLKKEQAEFEKEVDKAAKEQKVHRAIEDELLERGFEPEDIADAQSAIAEEVTRRTGTARERLTQAIDDYLAKKQSMSNNATTEFYNQSHNPETGYFDEGPDGPGRVRDPGTEDLGKPGTVSEGSGKEGESTQNWNPETKKFKGGDFDASLKAGKLRVVDVRKAPPSPKSVRDINKGFAGPGSKGGIGSYPDWTKYPGAPEDTSGDNWDNWIKTEGGKQFLADVEKFENPDQEKAAKDKAEREKKSAMANAFERLLKFHGTGHDEKSHGNWADGEGDYPDGTVPTDDEYDMKKGEYKDPSTARSLKAAIKNSGLGIKGKEDHEGWEQDGDTASLTFIDVTGEYHYADVFPSGDGYEVALLATNYDKPDMTAAEWKEWFKLPDDDRYADSFELEAFAKAKTKTAEEAVKMAEGGMYGEGEWEDITMAPLDKDQKAYVKWRDSQ